MRPAERGRLGCATAANKHDFQHSYRVYPIMSPLWTYVACMLRHIVSTDKRNGPGFSIVVCTIVPWLQRWPPLRNDEQLAQRRSSFQHRCRSSDGVAGTSLYGPWTALH